MRHLYLTLVFVLALSGVAVAQNVTSGPTIIPPDLAKQSSLYHELFLALAAAFFGGLLAPILQTLDYRLGFTLGAKDRSNNYQVQRDIASSLNELVTLVRQRAEVPPVTLNTSVPPDV